MVNIDGNNFAGGRFEEGRPFVSVIIPVFNGEKYLRASVESVLAQTWLNYEVLIVDDGSTDQSLKIALELEDNYPYRIEVLRHPGGVNRGVSATRNLALARAAGELVAFLDADDLWFPEKLAGQVAYMEASPEVGLCFSRAGIIREGVDKSYLSGVEEMGSAPPEDSELAVTQIITIRLNYIFSTVMVRRELILDVGGFIENLPFQTEDRMMVAMVGLGSPIGMVPEVLAEYRAHEENYTARVIRDKTEWAIHFDMQVRLLAWAVRRGRKAYAIDFAATILPATFLRFLVRVRSHTAMVFLKDLALLFITLPHWPLVVVTHRIHRAGRRLLGRR